MRRRYGKLTTAKHDTLSKKQLPYLGRIRGCYLTKTEKANAYYHRDLEVYETVDLSSMPSTALLEHTESF